MKRFGLQKNERIHLREEFQHLFNRASTFHCYPFRVLYLIVPNKESVEEQFTSLKFALSVPKKTFKLAVQRNLLKRRIKEAYRQNKSELKQQLSNNSSTLLFMLIYTGKKTESYQKIEEKIILILQQLQSIYEQDNQ